MQALRYQELPMKNKWYVAEYEVNSRPAYIAERKCTIKTGIERDIRTCGGFSRNYNSVFRLVNALNKREEQNGRK